MTAVLPVPTRVFRRLFFNVLKRALLCFVARAAGGCSASVLIGQYTAVSYCILSKYFHIALSEVCPIVRAYCTYIMLHSLFYYSNHTWYNTILVAGFPVALSDFYLLGYHMFLSLNDGWLNPGRTDHWHKKYKQLYRGIIAARTFSFSYAAVYGNQRGFKFCCVRKNFQGFRHLGGRMHSKYQTHLLMPVFLCVFWHILTPVYLCVWRCAWIFMRVSRGLLCVTAVRVIQYLLHTTGNAISFRYVQ